MSATTRNSSGPKGATMVWDELGRAAEDENKHDRDRWIGVYIGLLAVILALCSMGGSNAGKEATLKNIEATTTWAFFQAKNMRRHALRLRVDEMEILRADMERSASSRAAIEAKIVSYKEQDRQLTSDPKSGEGLDELFQKGKSLEAARDLAMRQDPYFDYGEAFLQIAIVLASISIISGGTMLLAASAALGAAGTFMTLNGFTLLVAIPFMG
jgi:hypothetical protein